MRILVVEDQKETAAVLKRKLEAECYAVDVEYDGERGFYKARTNDYDLILLDKGLPGKSGDEICASLHEYRIATPVMILSVAAEIEDKVTLLNCGADDYLTKPYAWSELAARMKALLRRPAQYEGNMLSVENLLLDRETYSLTFRKKTAYLTPKEFMLLEYLMKHAGRVVSRGMLLEHVWDDSVDQFSKSIDMHIMNLRKKIDPRNKDAFIRAVPGRGYIVGTDIESYETIPRVGSRARTIKITLEEHGGMATLHVGDNGCGMTPRVRAHLFEPFFTTKGEAKGIGIGLSTIRKIIEEDMFGTIMAESEPQQGTLFTVIFPIRHESTPENDRSRDGTYKEPTIS